MCGHLGDPTRSCRCTPHQLAQYRARISGPLLDRIDLHVEVTAVPHRELDGLPRGEPSATVRERVAAARSRQSSRLRRSPARTNAVMDEGMVRRHALPDPAGQRLLERAMTKLGLSARAYVRVLKVARTIADLAGRTTVGAPDVAEAVQYRCLDRQAETP